MKDKKDMLKEAAIHITINIAPAPKDSEEDEVGDECPYCGEEDCEGDCPESKKDKAKK